MTQHGAILAIVHKKTNQLFYLWDRWQDEKEYEDFAEYADYFEKLFEGTDLKPETRLTKGFKAELTHTPTGDRISIEIDSKGLDVKVLS